MAHRGEVFFDPQHDRHAKLLVGHLAAAELELHLQLVALVEELLGVANFRHVIVAVDVDPKFDLFDFAGMGFLVLFLLGQLVTVFAEVDDAADRRVGIGCHLDQIEPQFLRPAQRIGQFEDPELLVRRAVDDANLAGADAMVDPDGGRLGCA